MSDSRDCPTCSVELLFSQLKNINTGKIADWKEGNVGGDGLSENHRKHLCPLHYRCTHRQGSAMWRRPILCLNQVLGQRCLPVASQSTLYWNCCLLFSLWSPTILMLLLMFGWCMLYGHSKRGLFTVMHGLPCPWRNHSNSRAKLFPIQIPIRSCRSHKFAELTNTKLLGLKVTCVWALWGIYRSNLNPPDLLSDTCQWETSLQGDGSDRTLKWRPQNNKQLYGSGGQLSWRNG